MILVDIQGHLASDLNLQELHIFARSIGLKRRWFQAGRHPHYDLTTIPAYDRAVDAGALQYSTRDIIQYMARR